MTIGWGILATGRIAAAFADAVQVSPHNELRAVGSRSRASAEAFAARYPGTRSHASYPALLEDPQVQAIYVATPHPQHAEWTIRALRAGKHVLCEKPLGMNHAEVMAMVEAAERSGCFFMEAFMYRCHPQTLKLKALITEGAIGEVRHIQANFGYHATFAGESRLFANALGGGGILDVGCYPISAARLIMGREPSRVQGSGHLGSTGVDEWAAAQLEFDDGSSAQVATSVSLALTNSLNVYGSEGHIHVDNPWLCADAEGNWGFDLQRTGKDPERISGKAPGLYELEVDHVAECIREGRAQSPRMSWADSRANAAALDAWRKAIGLEYTAERPATHRGPLLGTLQVAAPQRSGTITHVDKPVSRLVMGCDNQPGMSHAAVMWDDYLEQGGNCFDTAYIYGGGSMERLLGHWHQQRNVREQIVIIGKGAHTPHNAPEFIATQLDESLERLQTDYVDLYFLHRDNLDIPVAEFVDALTAEVARGRIRAFGGSNWTLPRIRAANDYAAAAGRQGFTAVSNNFSLAHMVTPIWPGVEAATAPAFRDYLREQRIALLPWSSQARGFFTPWAASVIEASSKAGSGAGLTSVEPTADELRRTWFSEDNFERRRRAQRLADERGVDLIQIALAYVVRQPFACYPLIGPRQLSETRSSFTALDIELSASELAWLDLAD